MVSSSGDRPNDPRIVDDGPTRPSIERGQGVTATERYLIALAESSFLNLWCYPNVFFDKKSGASGDGKELCDLLVVCGDDILIFSDKANKWPIGDDIELAWKRWYKRAILSSVKQLRGAERWISQFPDRIFIDRACTQQLPIPLPPIDRRKVHGIVVANGAVAVCKRYFSGDSGSLVIVPSIEGQHHFTGEDVQPFFVGDVDPTGSFVHVFNEATLDIAMAELDTISDFTAYLNKKEEFIRSGRLTLAAGEEELIAEYMVRMNEKGEHDFVRPDGSAFSNNDHVTYDSGFYSSLLVDPQYMAKKEADRASYAWDELIKLFTDNVLAGATLVPDGQSSEISVQEAGLREMALVRRFERRLYGARILEAMELGQRTDKFMRAFMPGPNASRPDTGFFFVTLKIPEFELKSGYHQYRAARQRLLETYALSLLRDNPSLERVVGIATEPKPSADRKLGSSEEMIFAEPPEWTTELLSELETRKKIT